MFHKHVLFQHLIYYEDIASVLFLINSVTVITDIVSSSNDKVHLITFLSLKRKIIELLYQALKIATDATNTQMLLGGLMLLIQDTAMCESAEQVTLQPHDASLDSENQPGEFVILIKIRIYFKYRFQSVLSDKGWCLPVQGMRKCPHKHTSPSPQTRPCVWVRWTGDTTATRCQLGFREPARLVGHNAPHSLSLLPPPPNTHILPRKQQYVSVLSRWHYSHTILAWISRNDEVSASYCLPQTHVPIPHPTPSTLDTAMYECAEQVTLQPHDASLDSENQPG